MISFTGAMSAAKTSLPAMKVLCIGGALAAAILFDRRLLRLDVGGALVEVVGLDKRPTGALLR
jgi:hypothetical protein